MNEWFYIIVGIVVVQRLVELWISKQNADWMKSEGGYEVGRQHYPLIVVLHVCFFLSLWIEAGMGSTIIPSWWMLAASLFVLAQGLRIWCLLSLGKYWNTRIWIVPGHQPVTKGPYQYMRHPNYVIVGIEMLALPLIFGAYGTAVTFSLLHAAVTTFVRVPVEEEALIAKTPYLEEMQTRRRFLYWRR
ncbi:isoprenylcysteine carboxyl methyltransferase family protein [Mechercharimyces sp. CAU 1602]|uniref:isoprenylcysteine carboxyl methyltransferase family protein n=1 Tax=Mechercharimyces sp. CAU 1602 TaxID=2973933 RepID=UPI002161BF17|nr:isoprenylcysteine carboxylmethyltransferase family protein [Mechercharimyces sp. CAU 1602]MCS1351803.1 isoprenylcysteine carboxyl methyltransferase [Mechercharimyces sp. CAU 1602]